MLDIGFESQQLQNSGMDIILLKVQFPQLQDEVNCKISPVPFTWLHKSPSKDGSVLCGLGRFTHAFPNARFLACLLIA